MKRNYRIVKNIEAKNAKEVVAWLDEATSFELNHAATVANVFTIQQYPLTNEDETAIFEIAREALMDSELFDHMADKLDLSDEEMQALLKKIKNLTSISTHISD